LSTHWVFNSTQIRGMMSKLFSFRKILNSFYCVLEQFPDKNPRSKLFRWTRNFWRLRRKSGVLGWRLASLAY